MKKIEEMMGAMVKNNYIVAANIELDAFSYPIPRQYGAKMAECFFMYSSQPVTRKSRPYAWCAVDPETGSLMQYSRCECNDFAANLKIPMEQQIDYSAPVQCSYRELKGKQREYAALYARVREFAFAPALSDEQANLLNQYMNLHGQLINPDLEPFYRELSHGFYEWVEKNKIS